ncbi:MAG: hypothetical protein GX025_08085 [Clostridiales bacterium]|nr:hypothetical protein [Clostridiales bacterium]
MLYCPQCGVYIRGKAERCVLCQSCLEPSDKDYGDEEVFPEIPLAFEAHLALRILVFISFTAIIASFSIRMLFPTAINWPVFVAFGLVSMWLGLIVILRKRHNIPKAIIWQVSLVALLSLFWDWQTGWHGWSLDYVIPASCVTAELLMYISAKIMKLGARDYIIYAMLGAIFGILPVAFILFNWVRVLYPAVICVTVSIVFLAGIFIFQGKDIRDEWNKRMHI